MPLEKEVGTTTHNYEDGISDGANFVNFESDGDYVSGVSYYKVVILT